MGRRGGGDPRGEARKLIPVRVADCEPDAWLQTIVTIDFVGRDEEGAREALLEGLPERAKPEEKPSFPGVERSVDASDGVPYPGPHEPTPVRVWLDQVERDHRHLMPYFERRGAPLLEHVYVELKLDPRLTCDGAEERIRHLGRSKERAGPGALDP